MGDTISDGGTWRWKHQNLSFFACRGQRPYMEDRMHYMNDPYNNLSIFSIFDGHGGPVSFCFIVICLGI